MTNPNGSSAMRQSSVIQIGHGGGGLLMYELLNNMVLPRISSEPKHQQQDAATIEVKGRRLAFTTDAFVVSPIFFSGGDIGSLAVNGTINDLSMVGARPLALSCALILEEGFPLADLDKILGSMRRSADLAGVSIVTGDTKVVERGKADGIFITTAGIGLVTDDIVIEPTQIQEGDAIIVSGDLGRHGVAVMAAREGLDFEHSVMSDCAPLHAKVADLLNAGVVPHCMRDLTRGGLGAALIELAYAANVHFCIDEANIPVCEAVRSVCEILGFDPMFLANEGRFVLIVGANDRAKALALLEGASLIGRVESTFPGRVSVRNAFGGVRLLSLHEGDQWPRIC